MLIFMMGQGAFHFLFCLWRQPIHWLWLCATYRPADYTRHITKHRWRSVDTQFHDGAGSISLSTLPIKTPNTLFMTICNLLPLRLPKIYDQESLALCWCSFSWWGREHFTFSFAHTCSEYFINDYLKPIAHKITQDTWPRMFDHPVTLTLPRVYVRYAIIWFGLVHHSHSFGSLSSVFMYLLLDHYIVL